MLRNVHIRNLALIKEADIDFENGLNCMTGETGAGKSIIIGSVNIALGEKANRSMVRSGADSGLVEIQFTDVDQKVISALEEADITPDGSNITITRKISSDSSLAKINGETVTLSNLKKITSMLVDIHGQHDHQSLLNSNNHIMILDKFGGEPIAALKEQVRGEYDHFKSIRRELLNYNMDQQALEREKSLLEHELKEIERAALTPGEDDALEAEFKKLNSAERISESILKAYNSIEGEGDSIRNQLAKAIREVASAFSMDESVASFRDTLMDLDSISKDLSQDMEKYINDNKFDGERLAFVQDRLDQINRLKNKYGSTIEEILKYSDDTAKRLNDFENYAESKAALEKQLYDSKVKLNQLAHKLSDERHKTAGVLEPMIIRNLKDLNFLSSEFVINFEKADKISSNGFDKVEFLISTNPGEAVKPLAKVASGGELSRIMLAIKASVADNDDIPTLIFDEIDTGISGKTAQMVAEKLEFLSHNHQIICITHLPQIAAMADTHFQIHKEAVDGSTISDVTKLDDEGMISEIAGLIGGQEITEITLNNARELKERAEAFKKG